VQDQPRLSEDQSLILASNALKAGGALPDGRPNLLDGKAAVLMAWAVSSLGDHGCQPERRGFSTPD
jgi:hypothetical protein